MELFLAGTVSGVGWATPGEKNTWPKALILVKPTCAGWLSQDGHSGPHATWAPLSVFKLHFNGKKMGKAQPLYSSQTSPSQIKEKPVWPSGNRRCQRTSGPFPISSAKNMLQHVTVNSKKIYLKESRVTPRSTKSRPSSQTYSTINCLVVAKC